MPDDIQTEIAYRYSLFKDLGMGDGAQALFIGKCPSFPDEPNLPLMKSYAWARQQQLISHVSHVNLFAMRAKSPAS